MAAFFIMETREQSHEAKVTQEGICVLDPSTGILKRLGSLGEIYTFGCQVLGMQTQPCNEDIMLVPNDFVGDPKECEFFWKEIRLFSYGVLTVDLVISLECSDQGVLGIKRVVCVTDESYDYAGYGHYSRAENKSTPVFEVDGSEVVIHSGILENPLLAPRLGALAGVNVNGEVAGHFCLTQRGMMAAIENMLDRVKEILKEPIVIDYFEKILPSALDIYHFMKLLPFLIERSNLDKYSGIDRITAEFEMWVKGGGLQNESARRHLAYLLSIPTGSRESEEAWLRLLEA